MPRLLPAAALAAALAVTSFAQDVPKVVVAPEKLVVKAGDPLSDRALVQKPTPIKGVQSWTVESRKHRGTVHSSALSPDGKLIATGGIDGTVRVWHADTGELAKAFVGHDWYVTGLSFSPDGRYLASGGSHDRNLRIWEVATGLPVRVLKGMQAWTGHVAWSPDGRTIVAAGGQSGYVVSWDAATGDLKKKIELGRPIRAVAWHPSSREVVVTCTGQPVTAWEPDAEKPGRQYGEVDQDYLSMRFSPDGKTLAAGTAKEVRLFDPETAALIRKTDGGAVALAWEPNGKRLARTYAAVVGLIDPATGKETTFRGVGTDLHFTPAGDQLFAVTSLGLAAHEPNSGKAVRTQVLGGTDSAAWQPNRPMVSGVGTLALTLWDPPTGKKLRDLTGHTAAVKAFAWSPDGKLLATASADKTAKVFDAATGDVKHTFTGHTAAVNAVAFAPDGKQVLTGGADTKGFVWEALTGKVTVALPVHHREITAAAFGPGGQTIATGGLESVIRIFTGAGKPVKELTDAEPAVFLMFTADGKLLSSPRNHVPRVWSVATGKVVLELPVGSPEHATAAAIAPTGNGLAAVGRANHTLNLVDLRGLRVLPTKFLTQAPAESVAWGPASRFLAVSSNDRCTRFFDPATGAARGVIVREPDYLLAVDESGHIRAGTDDPAEVIYVAQTDKGQETLTPAGFADRFKWRNVPANAKPSER